MKGERFCCEIERLRFSPSPEAKPGGLGIVKFVGRCPGLSSEILTKVKVVLALVSEKSVSQWPSMDEWRNLLPLWFLERCAPSMTMEQAEAWLAWWRGLSEEERRRVEQEKEWSLEDWLYWMEPDNRSWTWWDGCGKDADNLAVALEVTEWPFPWGAFRWLLLAAGAIEVESEG
jgi:hypothetical protein